MSAARIWTVEEGRQIISSYRMERARHLSNSLCSLDLARRDTPHGSYFADGRKGSQRLMATLRRNWMPVLSVLAKAKSQS